MKETLKDIGGIALDVIITIFLAIIALNIIGSILISTAMGAEPVKLTKSQEVVAKTILGEARGEGKAGMYAVACVIAQRAIVRNKTPKQICEQPSQFSFWTKDKRTTLDDRNRAAVERLMKHDIEIVLYAKSLAVHIMNLDRSYTSYADHYCTVNCNPYWVRGRKPVKIIGHHKFFKLNPLVFGINKSSSLTQN